MARATKTSTRKLAPKKAKRASVKKGNVPLKKKKRNGKAKPKPLAMSIWDRPFEGVGSSSDFGSALTAIKSGYRVSREGWNGVGQFVFLAPAKVWKLDKKTNGEKRLIGKTQLPLLLLKNAQGQVVQWVPSAGDLLADDWYVN